MKYYRVLAVFLVVLLGWTYQALQPPPPKKCGSQGGPPITSPRIQLSDGRHLAYKESGTPKHKARYKIITVHGFDSSKEFQLPASQELVDELGIYFVTFDRAGYEESDAHPKRSVKSEAMDIEELADQLGLGSKFYVVGVSMGGYPVWGCLSYIPHRLAGAAFVAPVTNYWWPSFPIRLSKQAYRKLFVSDQWSLWIAHNAPSLLYGWMTQKWFPTLTAVTNLPATLTEQDLEVLRKWATDFNAIGELVDELGIYFVSFDGAKYEENDVYPKRSVKSDTMDIEELADKLGLGSKFYMVGVSMGVYPIWGCLNYIPHRLAGVDLSHRSPTTGGPCSRSLF